jgi:hypothetical protein
MEVDSNLNIISERESLISELGENQAQIHRNKSFQVNLLSNKINELIKTELEINVNDNLIELNTATGISLKIDISDLLNFSLSPEFLEYKKCKIVY